jgi:hypothetical protein
VIESLKKMKTEYLDLVISSAIGVGLWSLESFEDL